jgi:hypothetical protein
MHASRRLFGGGFTFGLALAAAVLLSCSSSGGSSTSSSSSSGSSGSAQPGEPNGPQLFSSAVEHVVIETAYVPGAEPYVGKQGDFADIWSLFRANALTVFDGKKDVTLPTTLPMMEKLDDVPAGDMSKEQILELAASHRQITTDLDSKTQAFYVVFVNGRLLGDDGAPEDDTLGASIDDSGVIAIFKPTYTPYFSKKNAGAQVIEQLAVTHYFGHAVGFVNNGVPLAPGNESHQDTANGSHCTNKQCAMSVAFETPEGAADFIGKFPVGSETVVIGQECLSDARILENTSAK